MDIPTSFGAWIKERRKQLDLTQNALAECTGCTVATIRKIEAEERRPSQQVAELLATCLQIPVEQHTPFIQIARGKRRIGQLEQVASVPNTDLTLAHLLPTPKSNLPLPPTPLLGREDEVSSISKLVQDPHCRLLTLIGPGGVGKTRLSIQIATEQQAAFTHGAAFISLAPVQGREQAVTAIADALGFVLYAATDRAQQLFHYLHDKDILLVLDNLEHLLGDEACVALVGDLLHHVPAVKLIVTSREPLHLQAEWVFKVQGLPVPDSIRSDDLATSSGVQLFLQRAQRARTDFELTSENRSAILQICQLVEGLPLAIELAAAWVLTLSCQEIAQELERDLNFLVTSTRDVPERHRSLSAVFNHSWILLTAEEQQVLRRLAVFRGGFGREAAEYIAGASLPLLSNLVTKSLLRRTDAKAGRYDLHELVRQYVLGQLQNDDQEYNQTRQRHCRYYSALLARRGLALKGTERTAVVTELIQEIANLRLAWHWATTHQQAEALSQAADTLFWLYESRSNCREGVPLFGQAIDSLQTVFDEAENSEEGKMQRLALGQALNYQGFFRFRQGQHPQSRELLQRSLGLLQPLADTDTAEVKAALSDATAFLGTVTSVMGDYPEGHRLLREGLSMKHGLQDRWGSAFCLRQLGLSAYYLGEYTESYRLLTDSLAISRELGNTWAIASSLNALSLAAFAQGNYSEAQQLLKEGLAQSQRLEDRFNIAVSLNGLGLVSQAMADEGEAQRFFRESIAIWREIGDDGDLAQSLNNLGNSFLAFGSRSEAEQVFLEALEIAHEAEMLPVALDALLGLGILQAAEDNLESAIELLVYIQQHPASLLETKKRAENLKFDLGIQLSPQQIRVLEDRAHHISLNDLVSRFLVKSAS